MPPAASLFRLLFLILAMAFLATGGEAHAQSSKNDPLLEADRLIADQNYNEAIIFLTDFIKLHPERFDDAQARLKKVIKMREEYNRKAQALMEVLRNTPEDKEQQLALIKELAALDKNPNQEIKATIDKTKAAALFVYNRSQYEKILTEGRGLIDTGKFAEAARVYETGFVLYREEFDSGPYDDLTKKSVAALVDRVKAEVSAYEESQAGLESVVKAFAEALDQGDIVASEDNWSAARILLEDRAKRRNRVVAAGRAMMLQFEAIQKQDQTVTDSSFLPFAFRFTLGRSSSSLPEGVSGAMDTQWIILLNSVQAPFEKRLDLLYADAAKAYDEGRWNDAASAFELTARYARPGLEALALWSLTAPTEALPTPTAYGKSIVTEKTAAWERAKHLSDLCQSQSRLARLAAQIEGDTGKLASYAGGQGQKDALGPALASYAAFRKNFVSFSSGIGEEGRSAADSAAEIARWQTAGLGNASSGPIQAAYEKRISSLAEKSRTEEIASAALAFSKEFGELDKEYAARQAAMAKGKLLLEGTPGTAAAIVPHYPSASATLLVAEAPLIAAFGERVADYLGRIAREVPYVAKAAEVMAWEQKAKAVAEGVKALEGQRSSTLAQAQERKRQAEVAKSEAELRMKQARDALAAENFDTARDRLAKADEKYLVSLSFEDNAELRASSDASRQKLGADIVKAENDKVVRETRALITEGKTYYFQSAFAKSEDALLQARARWKTTHGDDPEPEVEYWIRLAQVALSVKTGRDIPATAPLYAEMSQLLSLARTYYNKGKSYLDQKRKTDALQAFDAAKKAINQVKVVFPLNQEAGVLALRIDQLTDPTVFKQTFALKFEEASAGLRTNPREAYSQLQDLAAIDPRYPGMKDALTRAEIILGIRLAPADPAKVRRANALIAAAKAIVDSGDTGRFAAALTQINEAIELDPNNDRALTIKDRIQTAQGGTAQLALSSYAEEQYRLAVEEFQNGNYLQANAIIERLLQDAKNKRSQKINDLYKKIQARL